MFQSYPGYLHHGKALTKPEANVVLGNRNFLISFVCNSAQREVDNQEDPKFLCAKIFRLFISRQLLFLNTTKTKKFIDFDPHLASFPRDFLRNEVPTQ